MQNRVVVRSLDGTIHKGTTNDFFPQRPVFHVSTRETGDVQRVDVRALKAVFFVKSFDGDRSYQERSDVERAGYGKKTAVRFKDGETQVGYTQGYARDRLGFFFFPSDAEANNERIFVVNAATEEVRFV
ncbi:MAG: hypothetical protein HZB55_05975 [Deltaproteobacteria bacterium]|nr:hypothetical protein [Deltaproteobacteria bacterium]